MRYDKFKKLKTDKKNPKPCVIIQTGGVGVYPKYRLCARQDSCKGKKMWTCRLSRAVV